MSRYIDADVLIDDLIHNRSFYPALVAGAIKNTPTADVVEVRHGTWYHGTDNGAVYAKCSACGRKMNYSCYGYAYCSLCGAKMNGERKENGT